MAGFVFRKNKYGLNSVPSESEIIKGSETLTIGDVASLIDGLFLLASAGGEMYGIVQGFETYNGRPLENSLSGTDYDGTYTEGGVGTGTYVAAADNATDKRVRAIVRPFVPGDIYVGLADAALATTSTSDDAGGFFDCSSTLDGISESSFSQSTAAQWFSYGQDPVLAGRYVLVEAHETQSGIQSA